MRKIISRLKEPSTWAGLGVLATLFGVPTPVVDAVMSTVNVVAGAGVATSGGVVTSACALLSLAAVFLPERKAAAAVFLPERKAAAAAN